MDWRHAKTILIIALIITDLFLVGVIARGDSANDTGTDNSAMLEEILAENNIYVDCDADVRPAEMPALTVQYIESDDVMLAEKLAQSGHAVVLDVDESSGVRKVTYGTEVDGYPVEESFMVCTYRGGGMASADIRWLDPVNLSQRKMATGSSASALIGFMSEYSGDKEIHIQDVRLIYWLDESGTEGDRPVYDTALPAWKITYDGGRAYYQEAGLQQ